MGIFDKLKVMVGAADEDEFDDEDIHDEYPIEKREDEHSSSNIQMNSNNKVVNIHATTQLQVVLVKPEHFDDAKSVAEHLKSKRTVVLNLESTNKDISRRLVDFLSGVAYAQNGQIKRVANSTFIITPYNVDIVGDLLDELENNGLYL